MFKLTIEGQGITFSANIDRRDAIIQIKRILDDCINSAMKQQEPIQLASVQDGEPP